MKLNDNLIKIVLLMLVIILSVTTCSQYRKKQKLKTQQQSTLSFLEDSVSYYKDKYGEEIATKKILVGGKDQLQILLSKQIDSTQQFKSLYKKYKRISAASIVNTVTVIDSIPVPFKFPVEKEFTRDFKIDNQNYFLKGVVNSNGLNIKNLTIFNSLTFVMGEKKQGWFKSNTYSIDIKNSNSLIKTIGVDSYVFKPAIKRWTLGPYVGYDFIQQNISIGFSLQYGVIRF